MKIHKGEEFQPKSAITFAEEILKSEKTKKNEKVAGNPF